MATRKPSRSSRKSFGLLPVSEVVNPTLLPPPVTWVYLSAQTALVSAPSV